MGDTGSSEAAETGSLIHLGIRAYHETGSERAALAVLASSASQFPRANQPKARKHFEAYCARQSAAWGTVVRCEYKIQFTIPPAEYDPTQEAIHIEGTLDQLREQPDGSLLMIDVKTGSKRIEEMMPHYCPQLSAYQYACMQLYPGRVVNAAILRTLDFIYGGPVVHRAPWGMDQALDNLDFVRHEVAQVRAGRLIHRPGTHCQWCPMKGVENCKRGKLPTTNAMPDMLTPIGSL